MKIQHVDGEGTTLVLDSKESYVLALALIRAADHGFDFAGWQCGPLREWSLKHIQPAQGTKDYERAYGIPGLL
jgi:hypothetical protein